MHDRAILCVLASVLTASGLCAQLWTPRPATPAPVARTRTAMAFDSARGVTVLFGGQPTAGGPVLADTWEWNGATWTQQVVPGPQGRFNHCMAYDSARGRVVLFGGSTAWPVQGLADTWEWSGTAWVPILIVGPTPRLPCRMAYDQGRQRMVLVGRPAAGGSSETWEYNGSTATWSLAHSGSPATWGGGVFPDPLTYHGGRQRTVLVVGAGGASSASWEWDGVSWVQRLPTTPAPSPSTGGGEMVYDVAAQRLVLLSMAGWASPARLWEWDGGLATGWVERLPAQAPAVFDGHALCYDSWRSVSVAFGSNLATAWEYDSLARAAQVSSYGTGCGQPPLQSAAFNGSRPLLGGTFLVDVGPVPAGLGFMSVGFSRTTYLAFNLPLPLDGFGMTGCLLHHDFVVPLLSCPMAAPSTARFALAIPQSQQLLGFAGYLQGAAVAPGTNPAGIVASNGVEFVIGSF